MKHSLPYLSLVDHALSEMMAVALRIQNQVLKQLAQIMSKLFIKKKKKALTTE